MESNSHKHQESLHAYDPARAEPPTDACADGMEAALADRALRQWWEQEQSFDRAFGRKLREVPVPADLSKRILAAAARVEAEKPRENGQAPARNGWHWSAFAGAAAAVLFVALFYTFAFKPFAQPTTTPELENLMAQLETMLSERTAEIHPENSFTELVKFLETGGAPIPKFIPAGLPQQDGFACANLKVGDVPVGMMCFKVEGGVYHIFTVQRKDLPQQPDLPREVVRRMGSHCCATWTREDQLYILATTEPEDKMLTLL